MSKILVGWSLCRDTLVEVVEVCSFGIDTYLVVLSIVPLLDIDTCPVEVVIVCCLGIETCPVEIEALDRDVFFK